VFEKLIAICTPLTIIPANKPETAFGPKRIPAAKGEPITRSPGAIIFLIEAFVEIAMHLL
jgi:hypothetical protein